MTKRGRNIKIVIVVLNKIQYSVGSVPVSFWNIKYRVSKPFVPSIETYYFSPRRARIGTSQSFIRAVLAIVIVRLKDK